MLVYAEPTPVSLAAGFCLAVCGELIRLWGVSVAGTETRTTGSVGGTHLFVDGPFGYVRNPLYLGNMLIYTGVGIMANALTPYLVAVALGFFLIQYELIVLKEEEYLQKTFGDDFSRYVREVPRFLPRISRYKAEGSFHRDPDLSRGIQSERRTLQAFSALTVVLIVLFFLRRA